MACEEAASGKGVCLVPETSAATCGDPIGATISHSADCDLRLVCRGGTLTANRCVLYRASSVLRETLGLQLPTPGELQLPHDSAAAWDGVLKLLSLEAYPLQIVTMENLEDLLVLADKYDIPVVRGACAHFLHINDRQLRLSEPLSSAANALTAASLAAKYISTHDALQPYCTTVRDRLDALLSPLTRRPLDGRGESAADREPTAVLGWQLSVMRLVSQLEEQVATEEYLRRVAPEVQFKVSSAMLTALRNLTDRLPPFCQRCGTALGSGAEALHAECAESHYTSLHTKGCRLCGVPMPPAHARFCNSCAYRRNKF